MPKDYNEILLEAIDTVISGRLENLSFDKTIKCKIVDDSSKSEGKYIVSDGVIKIEAYCDTIDKYSKGDQVYVTVPQGDYTQRKVILSKYTENDAINPVAYAYPLDTMMNITGNIFSNADVGGSILANADIDAKNEIEGTIVSLFDINISDYNIAPEETVLYDTIGLSANFYTKLNDLDVRRGNYGLCLELIERIVTAGVESEAVTTVVFDSSEMFGNPYAFDIPLNQSIKINKGEKLITKIKGYLYQKDNFKYFNHVQGEYLDYPHVLIVMDLDGEITTPKTNNIFVSDINLCFGMDLIDLKDNTFELYVNDGNEYQSAVKKTIHSLWINKDPDTNEFIGFSDGVVDETYDEIEYLKTHEKEWKGSSVVVSKGDNIPDLKESLQIYSNAKDITQQLKKIKDFIESSSYLKGTIESLQRNLNAFNIQKDSQEMNTLSVLINTDIPDVYKLIENPATNSEEVLTLENKYIDYLEEKIDSDKAWVEVVDPIEDIDHSSYDDIKISIENLFTKIDELYASISELYAEDGEYPNIKTYVEQSKKMFDQVRVKINKSLDIIDNYIISQSKLMKKLNERLIFNEGKAPEGLKTIREEYQEFINKNKNKYCIYWYHYKKGHKNDDDYFYKEDWERILFGDNIIIPGMPEFEEKTEETVEGDTAKIKVYKSLSETPYTTEDLDTTLEEEKYKAILFFNHERYEADIVFQNTGETPSSIDGDLNDALYIEVGSSLDSDDGGKSYSMESHQLYNSYYTLLKDSDRYINRKIRIRFDGVQGKDEMLANTQVFWYVPTQATMLNYDEVRLNKEGFSRLPFESELLKTADDEYIYPDDYVKHHKEGYVCFYKNIRGEENEEAPEEDPSIITVVADTFFWYQIQPIYNPILTNNSIICKIVKNNFDYETEKLFTFSTYGNNGTDYTLSILPAENQSALMPDLNDKSELDGSLKLKAYLSDYNGNALDAVVVKSWFLNNTTLAIEPIKDDNNNETSEFEIIGTLNEKSCLYNVLQATAQWGKISSTIDANQTLTLTTLYPVAYSTGHYYIDGASTVIYNSEGTMPQYYNGAYKIYNKSDNKEKTDVSWELWHYNSDGVCILKQRVINNKISYYDKVTSVKKKDDEEENVIPDESLQMTLESQVPKISYNNTTKEYKLNPLTMYLTNSNIYSVAICKNNEDKKIIFAQPLYIGQNRYGSPMLNSWDESLQIDEENNTILTAMIGAGYKDENNAFHGVVMGDVQSKLGDNSVTVTGLYGFHAGAQSFGWKVDGTGFIGKSGRGRIEFDGNKGVIKSASYTEDNEKMASGTLIDLDDGKIILKGAKTGILKSDSDTEVQKDIYGLPIYASDTRSCIKLDVQSPYFTITSAKGNDLVYIGDAKYKDEDGKDIEYSDDEKKLREMYLKSDNYKPTKIEIKDGEEQTTPGEGMKIDLNEGHIDAYNFKLTSAGIQINSNPNKNENYIIIGDDAQGIIYGLDENAKSFMELKTNSLKVNAGEWESGKIEINTSPGTEEYYLAVGVDKYSGDSWTSAKKEDRKKESYLAINASGVEIKTPNFWLKNNGDIEMTGIINALSGGTIAGWNIQDEYMVKYGDGAGWAGTGASNNFDRDGSFLLMSSGKSPSMKFGGSDKKTDWRLTIGQYFGVDSEGSVYCSDLHASNGSFKGDITGASGTFSGSITGASGTFSGNVGSEKSYADNVYGTYIGMTNGMCSGIFTVSTIKATTVKIQTTNSSVMGKLVLNSDNTVTWVETK